MIDDKGMQQALEFFSINGSKTKPVGFQQVEFYGLAQKIQAPQ
jgi:hypothetical protein